MVDKLKALSEAAADTVSENVIQKLKDGNLTEKGIEAIKKFIDILRERDENDPTLKARLCKIKEKFLEIFWKSFICSI